MGAIVVVQQPHVMRDRQSQVVVIEIVLILGRRNTRTSVAVAYGETKGHGAVPNGRVVYWT
ncbi:hypothetical protein RSAG8_01251, partial [Rhizoctonia solani AG-8 WAC10335]